MSIKASRLAAEMVSAAKDELGTAWPGVADFAKHEFAGLARAMVMIGELVARGKVSKEQARLILDIQKNSTRMVMLTIEGLGVIGVERAINAALGTVRQAVNGAVGWRLL